MTYIFLQMNKSWSLLAATLSEVSKWSHQQKAVLLAVILQDMKTRFGAGYFSYLIAIFWPLTHVATIAVAYMVVNHYAPIGDDPFVFVATAAIPYMLCLYPARLIAMAIAFNKPFLSYSRVTPQHIIVARTSLEFMNVAIVTLIIFVLCYVFDRDVLPLSVTESAAALGASVFFGVSLGFFFAVLTAGFGAMFVVLITILMLLLYISSLAFVPDYLLDSKFREYLSYNPMFCLIKWLRAAYYPSYQLDDIPKVYVLSISLVILFVALLGERFLRGRIIGG